MRLTLIAFNPQIQKNVRLTIFVRLTLISRKNVHLGARNNFGKFEIFSKKKVYYTSCRARRAVSENRGPRPLNPLWAV